MFIIFARFASMRYSLFMVRYHFATIKFLIFYLGICLFAASFHRHSRVSLYRHNWRAQCFLRSLGLVENHLVKVCTTEKGHRTLTLVKGGICPPTCAFHRRTYVVVVVDSH
ncbi:unnamed protein product, partial [Pylaiella littoralis]